ncbi:diguanylate cyclase/phosphodiesterase with PAS/PAC sensor [Vibrio paracholerae 87395]|nr:diguanylate cyclase/phosphodiesterase with PAS/PAC sensor [Vibrio paracholerae 87395]
MIDINTSDVRHEAREVFPAVMTQPHRNRSLSFEGQQGRLTAEDYPTIPQTRPFDDVARCLIEAQRDDRLLNALTHFFRHAEQAMALTPNAYQDFRSTLRAFNAFIEKNTEQQQLLAALALWIRWLSASQKPSTPTEPMTSLVVFASQRLADVAVPMLSDLHSHHHAFERLRDSERRLHDAMDYAQIGHWSSPYEGTRSQWSPQIYDLLGLERTCPPGLDTLKSVIDEDFMPDFIAARQRCFETGEDFFLECPVTRQSDGERRWIECRGQVHYLKSGEPERLSGFIQDITSRKESEETITQLAYFDPLTSLPNRRWLLDKLTQQCDSLAHRRSYCAVLHIDIDDFKKIIDLYGHPCGDTLLMLITKRICALLRPQDTLARIGHDEFMLMLCGLPEKYPLALEQVDQWSTQLLETLAQPYTIDEHKFVNSASIGMALFNDNSVGAEELIDRAGMALTYAKHDGKNVSHLYHSTIQDKLLQRLHLESSLRQALELNQLALFYQPQVHGTHLTIGAEALIRWFHPEHGLIAPDDFIPLAEETGLIISIGDWVLEQACLQLSRWQSDFQYLTLSVNVSYKQFTHPDFVTKVESVLERYPILPGTLKLELTETLLVDDIELTIAHMQALKVRGIIFSLDDFGTGYSSLQYLKRLPISQIKIDRSFVSELEDNPNDQSIVTATIAMAKALGIDVIAEGVETHAQAAFLREHGCDTHQGYYYSPPLSLCDFERYLQANVRRLT